MAASPSTLRSAAGRLEQQAGWLAGALDAVMAASGPEVWQGPAADRFIDGLRQQRAALRSAADELRSVARRLFQTADMIERRLAEEARKAAKSGGARP